MYGGLRSNSDGYRDHCLLLFNCQIVYTNEHWINVESCPEYPYSDTDAKSLLIRMLGPTICRKRAPQSRRLALEPFEHCSFIIALPQEPVSDVCH